MMFIKDDKFFDDIEKTVEEEEVEEKLKKLQAFNEKLIDDNKELRDKLECKTECLNMAKELLDYFRSR